MGGTTWGARDWASYSSTSASASTPGATHRTVYTSSSMPSDLDPKAIVTRESRNSSANPKSTPIMVWTDVTGSMGQIAHEIIKSGLGVMVEGVLTRKPVSDPHIAFGGIGDVHCDRAPLQVTQFEADIKMVDQLLKIYMEGGGGGNSFESYNLAWHFAAYHTSCDAWKDSPPRKGFLFTLGDENPPPNLTADDLKKVYGRDQEVVATNQQLLEELRSKYHVFHIIIAQGNAMQYGGTNQEKLWRELLGQNVLVLDDYTKLGELIISTMQVVAGDSLSDVAASWGGSTATSVSRALAEVRSEVAVRPENGLVAL